MSGRWSARVRQQCVISLDEFDDTISGDVHLDFIEERLYDEKKHKDIEPIKGDDLDTFEQMVQELSLNLNPFPKKPGAAIPPAFRAELQSPPTVNNLGNKVAQANQGKTAHDPATTLGQGLLRPTKPFANLAEKLKQKKHER